MPPLESRIKSSEFFIERAQKCVEKARKEVEDAKAKVVAAETTLNSEMSALQEGEQRHASLLAEASKMKEQPPPAMPVDFAAELVQLRSLVAELQREREELRFEIGQRGVATAAEESRPRKSIWSLSTPATDLILPHNQLAISSGSGRDPSVVMETLIDGGSAIASHRFIPCSSSQRFVRFFLARFRIRVARRPSGRSVSFRAASTKEKD